jgi:hypothetical protein
MRLDDVLCLSRANRPIRSFRVPSHAVEVGSHPSCDLAIPSEAVAPRVLLIQPAFGSLFVYDLVDAPEIGEAEVMPIGRRFPLGGEYALTRLKSEAAPPEPGGTEVLRGPRSEQMELSLVGAPGSGVRPVRVSDAPVSIGGAEGNRLVLRDPTVSRHHCRVEPAGDTLRIRDLGSTNGTWVDGARIERHELRLGSCVRVGRTLLRVVERSPLKSGGAVFASAQMASVISSVDRFAPLPWPVLIHGETGVGKEVIALALHRRGPRREGPFVAVNAGGLARELVESELFGHERGAFTGAVQTHRGAFEQAHGGTLFLDEIAELPVALQTRLLRVLESWHVRRLGSEADRSVDVRLVCATNADLRRAVSRGEFRSDLFYRLHRLVIEVPALRARRADIEPLAEHFLRAMRAEVGPRELSECGMRRLSIHVWPGNVRELRNVLELAAVESDLGIIDGGAVERAIRCVGEVGPVRVPVDTLQEVLEHYDGNVSAAARALGLPRSTLRDRMKASSPGRS